jgi:transcriptional regulator with XRE-family HTH domain
VDFRERIAENIDSEIKRSGLTKTQVAEELGVNLVTVIDYTKGRSVPSLESFYELCKILDCTYSDILD